MPIPSAEIRETPRVAFQILDNCADAAIRLVEAGGEHRIACRKGCNNCCADYIRVTHVEALAIAEWLLNPAQVALLARFRVQLAQWREATGPEVWLLEEFMSRFGGMPACEPEFTMCAQAAQAYQMRGLMCPFNGPDGSCEIYPVRPSPCRVTHVVDTHIYCRPGQGGLPNVVRHEKLTEITKAVRGLFREVSAGAGFPGEFALPNAVERAIATLKR